MPELRILIVEDDPDQRVLMYHYLRDYGIISFAESGEQAVRIFGNALEEGIPFTLVFMDIVLPNMDGHEALQRIRRLEEKKKVHAAHRTCVFMTTALGDSENIWKAQFEGMTTGYFIKPIRRKPLLRRLRELDLIPEST